jgi:hypothetical protein
MFKAVTWLRCSPLTIQDRAGLRPVYVVNVVDILGGWLTEYLGFRLAVTQTTPASDRQDQPAECNTFEALSQRLVCLKIRSQFLIIQSPIMVLFLSVLYEIACACIQEHSEPQL